MSPSRCNAYLNGVKMSTESTSDVDYDFVYVDQESFDVYRPQTFKQLLDSFTEYKI